MVRALVDVSRTPPPPGATPTTPDSRLHLTPTFQAQLWAQFWPPSSTAQAFSTSRVGVSPHGPSLAGHPSEARGHAPQGRTRRRGHPGDRTTAADAGHAARWPPPVLLPPLWQPPSQSSRHASAGPPAKATQASRPAGDAMPALCARGYRPCSFSRAHYGRRVDGRGRHAATRPLPRLPLLVGRIYACRSAAAEMGARALSLPNHHLVFPATTQRPLTASFSPPPSPPAFLLIVTSLPPCPSFSLRASPSSHRVPLPPHTPAATSTSTSTSSTMTPFPHSLPPSPVKMNPTATCSGSTSTSW